MMFVERSVRCSAPVRPRRCTVSVSASPSRMDAAAPGWSRSSDPASRCSTRSARSAESRSHVSRNALPTEACRRSGRWPSTFRHLCTYQRCTTPREPNTSVTARRSPGAPSMTNNNVRSVGKPRVTMSLNRPVVTAVVSVAPSRRPSTCSGPRRRSPTRSPCSGPGTPCRPCRPPAGPVPPKAARETPEALRRQRHEPPRHRTARCPPLGHVRQHWVQRARVPPQRHPGRDRGQRVLVQRGGLPRPIRSSPAVLRQRRSAPPAAARRPDARRALPDCPRSHRATPSARPGGAPSGHTAGTGLRSSEALRRASADVTRRPREPSPTRRATVASAVYGRTPAGATGAASTCREMTAPGSRADDQRGPREITRRRGHRRRGRCAC